MYFVTNRAFDDNQSGYKKLTKHPNALGPNELSAVSITGVTKPSVELLDDVLPKSEVAALKAKYHLSIDENQQHFVPLRIACETFDQATKNCKNVLIYVHGYNNDIKDIYSSARELERLYNVIVTPFSWPANGGGAMSGTLSYLADKRDARASEDALNRFIDIVGHYYALLTEAMRDRIAIIAKNKHSDNLTKQRELVAKLLEKECSLSVSLLCHSMGNYVLKHALNSSLAESRNLVFDNVILAAADANNLNHKAWVEKIRARKGVYVLINANDYALSWSRRKPGEEQRARLGHYLRNLTAKNTYYIDFTGLKGVANSHSYFDKKTASKNLAIKRLFSKLFAAENLLTNLVYQSHNNTYKPK
ncbi:alpha/beta hydrolase [Kangiella sp. TOML190]|uniref:alpha/beta hydrolase n=1 Tax=Kangiella sp. TOML190 TaxID=2931351 RepID=UPI00203BAC46|nr:alpha/beta hydrolase [Kangiella sp. TOML190]